MGFPAWRGTVTTYFISRHPGARKWAERQGLSVDRVLDHLEVAAVRPGDVVIGTLPINLAAEVCVRGARYLHLSLDLPFEKRGLELSADEMQRFGARIEEYQVEKISC